jgi:hypothetical protein
MTEAGTRGSDTAVHPNARRAKREGWSGTTEDRHEGTIREPSLITADDPLVLGGVLPKEWVGRSGYVIWFHAVSTPGIHTQEAESTAGQPGSTWLAPEDARVTAVGPVTDTPIVTSPQNPLSLVGLGPRAVMDNDRGPSSRRVVRDPH